jgi:hypothetical protein
MLYNANFPLIKWSTGTQLFEMKTHPESGDFFSEMLIWPKSNNSKGIKI